MKSTDICDRYQITFRQLHYWTTMGYLGDDRKEIGQGRARDYSDQELRVLRRMLRLVEAGVKPGVASAVAKGDVVAFEKLRDALKGYSQ